MRHNAIDLDGNVVEFWQVEVNLSLVLAVVAIAHGCVQAELAGGLLAGDVHRAAFGVAAKQRALRALQHFKVFHLEQRGAKPLRAAQIDAVDIDTHPWSRAGWFESVSTPTPRMFTISAELRE
jgi:hypothetical protein